MNEMTTPLELVTVLRDYSVEEFGGLFLYLPEDRRPEDRTARAWLELLRAAGLLSRSRRWRVHVNRVPQSSRTLHPNLFDGSVQMFEVYRVDRDRLWDVLQVLDPVG